MSMRSRAIVLKTIRYNDDSLIAEAFTETSGRVSFIVRIAHSRRAAIKHTLFRPLALLMLEWNHRPSSRLQRLQGASLDIALHSLPYDPGKTTISLFLAEFLHFALRAEPDASALFRYVSTSIEWLDACRSSYANFHLVFLLRLTRFLGFYPNLSNSSANSYFDLETACFVPARPLHNHFIAPPDAGRLPLLMRMNYATMHLFRFSGTERSRLLGYINDFYRLHLPDFPELKSLPILTEVFSS